jgi:hypothetical protein
MPTTPLFEYCVGQPPTPISAADEQWFAPIALHRPATVIKQAGDVCNGDTDPAVTHGDYFTAVHDFLSAFDTVLPRHLACGFPGCDGAPEVVRIHLVKHGAFYHPACVTLACAHHQVRMVLNVAVGALGRNRLAVEAGYFEQLHRNFPEAYIPQLYRMGVGRTTRRDPLPMFAAQWLDGFHEMHRSESMASAAQQWVVWDCDAGSWCLSEAQVADFFRRAVFILTYYFDPHTLSAIMEWHHAAGDFIVKRNADQSLDVRLITVRRYGPLFHLTADDSLDVNTLLDALTVFFLRTSLWMRLDRLDGVGSLVWSHDATLRPIWEGFIQGLEQFARLHQFPETFVAAATGYIANHDRHALRHMGRQILEHYPPDLPEAVLIEHHLDRHAACLATLIQECAGVRRFAK